MITVALVTLAALNAILTAWATVLDARHASALMRALGANSRQASSGLAAAQVLSALPGAILGVPLGVGLLKVAAESWPASPPALWLVATVLGTLLAATVLGTLLAVAALTTVTAGSAPAGPPRPCSRNCLIMTPPSAAARPTRRLSGTFRSTSKRIR